MKLKIRDGFIIRVEEGSPDTVLGVITTDITKEDERVIECGSEAVTAIQEFVDSVNSGSFKPRSIVKKLEKILRKYPSNN